MTRVKIEAGATFDVLNQAELRETMADWLDEIRRGVRFVRRSMAGIVPAAGTLTLGAGVTATGQDMGPDGSFLWAITRVAVSGLGVNERVGLFANDAEPSSFQGWVQAAAGHATFPGPGLVLNAGERLIVAGTGLTVGASIAVSAQAIELPIQLAWQLL